MTSHSKTSSVRAGWRLLILTFLIVVLQGVNAASLAQTIERDPYFENKTFVVLVPSSSGGNLDFSARLLARFLAKHVPGRNNFIVQNMPGGGGMTLSNYLFNVAPKDGLALGIVYQTAGLDQVLGTQAKYRFGDYSWIGRISSSTSIVVLHETSPVRTLEAMRNQEAIFGSIGRSSQSTYVPTLLRTVLGYKTRVIYGYKGAADTFLAMERGEVNGRTGSLDSLMATQPQWLNDGRAFAVAELSLESAPSLPGVPLFRDLAKTESERQILDYVASYTAFGVAFAGPPQVPANRLRILRRAFDVSVDDPEFKAEIERAKFAYDPKSGEYLQELATSFSAASPELVSRVKIALEETGSP